MIEDAAQAFGARGIATSVASTFSFFPTKNLFALGDGGLIAVNDAELAAAHPHAALPRLRAKKEFLYVGYNSRLDAMQASFLRIFLPHIDEWNRQRREAAARYTELLDGLVETPVDEDGHVYHMYCVRSPERDRLAAALEEAEIGSAIYYQPPLHLQPALRYLGYSEGDFPETEKASRENLCLPLWAGITEEQQAEVVSVLKRASESRPVLMRFPVNRHRVWQLVVRRGPDRRRVAADVLPALRPDDAGLLPAPARLAGRRARRRDQARDVRRLRLLQPLVALRLDARHVGRRARRHRRVAARRTSCSTRSRRRTPRGCRARSPRSTSCCCSPSSPGRGCSRAR